jgi:hypothetical protein
MTDLLNTSGILEKIFSKRTLEGASRFFQSWAWLTWEKEAER